MGSPPSIAIYFHFSKLYLLLHFWRQADRKILPMKDGSACMNLLSRASHEATAMPYSVRMLCTRAPRTNKKCGTISTEDALPLEEIEPVVQDYSDEERTDHCERGPVGQALVLGEERDEHRGNGGGGGRGTVRRAKVSARGTEHLHPPTHPSVLEPTNYYNTTPGTNKLLLLL